MANAGAERGKEEDGLVRLSEQARKVARIRTSPIQKKPLGPVLTATGAIRPNVYQPAHVTPKLSGKWRMYSQLQGAKVKRADALLVLDSIEIGVASSDLLKAKSALEVTKISFDRDEGTPWAGSRRPSGSP